MLAGCLLDIDQKECTFSLNGELQPTVVGSVFFEATKNSGFFAAASFMTYQQCRFNFGAEEFVYRPTNRDFKCFNDCGKLSVENAKIIPNHIRLKSGSIGTKISDGLPFHVHFDFRSTNLLDCPPREGLPDSEPCRWHKRLFDMRGLRSHSRVGTMWTFRIL